MPANLAPLGALPFRFRRPRILIIGCGDVGLRLARQLPARVACLALTSSPERVPLLRSLGIQALLGNLDHAASLRRLAGLATHIVHLAPPPQGQVAYTDPRTLALLRALRLRTPPQSLIYGSTSGVYGDCGGAWVLETRPVNPQTPRAQRRVHAEAQVRQLGRTTRTRTHILRIPGIYAPDREGGTPYARLLKGTPALQKQDDVYTNHIHADDLARICWAAVWRGKPQRISHANDDTRWLMGDYLDWAADFYHLARPPRVTRSAAAEKLTPMTLSFMGESRQLDNQRLKKELRVRLHYPTVVQGLARQDRQTQSNSAKKTP